MARAKKTWKTWTTKELDRLEVMRLAGWTVERIAAELGRTVPSVKCRLAQEDMPLIRRLADRWLKYLAGPHTLAAVAAAEGTTVWAVKQAKRKLKKAGFEVVAADWRGPPRLKSLPASPE